MSSTPGNRVRHFHFSLRLLLICMAILAFGSQVIAYHYHAAMMRSESVKALRQMGASVICSWTFDKDEVRRRSQRNIGLARTILGDMYFDRVTYVTLNEHHVSDKELYMLAFLPEIESLSLENTLIGDDAIEPIIRLQELKSLNIAGTNVSHISVSRLLRLKHLRHLDVTNTKLSLSDAKELVRALPECNVVYEHDGALISRPNSTETK